MLFQENNISLSPKFCSFHQLYLRELIWLIFAFDHIKLTFLHADKILALNRHQQPIFSHEHKPIIFYTNVPLPLLFSSLISNLSTKNNILVFHRFKSHFVHLATIGSLFYFNHFCRFYHFESVTAMCQQHYIPFI